MNIMLHAANYRKSFYAGDKPYRDCLIAALKHFDLTEFTQNTEFWTLGGKEWYEFEFLLQQGLKFGKNSYHNVDYKTIDSSSNPAVARHITNFFNIWKIWTNPVVLSFDSTNGLVDNNEQIWADLIDLGIAAARKTGKVSLNWNFLVGYGNVLFDNDFDTLFDRYERWLNILADKVSISGFKATFFGLSVISPKEGSQTPMVSGHCLIEHAKEQQ